MSRMDRFDPRPHRAGRPPTPGRLGYVQAFLNSFWERDGGGEDRWATRDGVAAWLRERDFDDSVGEAELGRTGALGAGLSAALLGEGWGGVAEEGGVVVRHGDETSWLEPAGDGPAAARALALGI